MSPSNITRHIQKKHHVRTLEALFVYPEKGDKHCKACKIIPNFACCVGNTSDLLSIFTWVHPTDPNKSKGTSHRAMVIHDFHPMKTAFTEQPISSRTRSVIAFNLAVSCKTSAWHFAVPSNRLMHLKSSEQQLTKKWILRKKTNIEPENWWLEDEFSFGARPIFRGYVELAGRVPPRISMV